MAAGIGAGTVLGVGVAAVALTVGTVALIEVALNKAMDRQVKQQAIDRQAAFESHVTDLAKIMSPEDAAIQAATNKPSITTAAGRAVYSFGGASSGGGLGGAGIDWAAWHKQAFGPAEDAGDTQQSAGDTMVRAAQTFLRAADGIRIFSGRNGVPSSTGGHTRIGGHSEQAHGSSGTVTKPTMFIAGEAGTEHYQFIPAYKGKGGGGSGVTIQGPLIGQANISSDMDVREVTAQIVREFEKAVSNG